MIQYQLSEHSMNATVYGENQQCAIQVYRNRVFGGSAWEEPTINWSAHGSVSMREAREYGALINKAAAVAEDLNCEPALFEIQGQTKDGRSFVDRLYAKSLTMAIRYMQSSGFTLEEIEAFKIDEIG